MAVYIKNGKAVTKDTRSKRIRKSENAARRSMWAIKPVTRIKTNGKAYNRKKAKQDFYKND